MLKHNFRHFPNLRKKFVFVFFSIFLLLFFQYYFFPSFISMPVLITIVKTEFIIIYTAALILSARISGYMSVYTLFLFTSFLFNYSRLFLDYFSDYSITDGDLFNDIVLSNNSVLELLYLVLFYLLAATLSFLIFYKKSYLNLKQNLFFVRLGKKIILALAIPLLLLSFLQLKYILDAGYLSIFNGDALKFKYNALTNLITRIVYFGYLLFLSGIPKRKEFIRISLFFISISFLSALKGQRGSFLLLIVYSLWYYHNIYNIKFNLFKGLKITAIILFFSQVIVLVRSSSASDEVDVLNLPYEFLRLNGISIMVPAYIIEFKTSLVNNGIPYLFTPIYDYFYRIFIDSQVFYEGRTNALLTVSNYLSNQLIYFINPPAYYAGMGTGTSYLAEFYDFGGLFLGSLSLFILIYFIMRWEYFLFSKRAIIFLSPVVVSRFIYMPRDSFFKIINDFLLLLMVFIFFNFLYKIKIKKL